MNHNYKILLHSMFPPSIGTKRVGVLVAADQPCGVVLMHEMTACGWEDSEISAETERLLRSAVANHPDSRYLALRVRCDGWECVFSRGSACWRETWARLNSVEESVLCAEGDAPLLIRCRILATFILRLGETAAGLPAG